MASTTSLYTPPQHSWDLKASIFVWLALHEIHIFYIFTASLHGNGAASVCLPPTEFCPESVNREWVPLNSQYCQFLLCPERLIKGLGLFKTNFVQEVEEINITKKINDFVLKCSLHLHFPNLVSAAVDNGTGCKSAMTGILALPCCTHLLFTTGINVARSRHKVNMVLNVHRSHKVY